MFAVASLQTVFGNTAIEHTACLQNLISVHIPVCSDSPVLVIKPETEANFRITMYLHLRSTNTLL